jgi:hypothetical protein
MDANSSRGAQTAEEMQMLAAIHQMATTVLQHVAASGLFMTPWFPSAPPPAFGPAAITGRWADAPAVWATPFPNGAPGMSPLAPALLPPAVHWAPPSWPMAPWAGGTAWPGTTWPGTWPAAPWTMARWSGLG